MASLAKPGARRLFLVVLGLIAFQAVFLIAERRVPLGHETGRRFGPRPGLLVQNAVLPVSPAIPGAPFLPVFHAGLFVEELVFLVGVWLLASKYYRSVLSRYVVAVAALGSCLWIDHAAANFLAWSSLPLILSLFHEFLETGRRPPLLLAELLAILQAAGRPPEYALLVPVAALLYAAGASRLFGYPLRARLKELTWTRRDALGAACLVPPAIVVTAMLLAPAAPRAPAPDFAGSVLTGIGPRNPAAFLDIVLGLAPSLDATLYCGFFTLAFALAGLESWGSRKSLRFLGFTAAALLLLACLPPLTAAMLSLEWRPAPQGVSLLRLMLIFVAGVGCDRMIETRSFPRPPAAILLVVSACIAVLVVFNPLDDAVLRSLSRAWTWGLSPDAVSPLASQARLVKNLAGAAALGAGLAAGVLFLRASGWRRAPLALALILFLHPLDVFGWKFRSTWLKSRSLSREEAAAQTLGPVPPPPFPGSDPLLPPVAVTFDRPYGEGATPLRPVAPADTRGSSPAGGSWILCGSSIVLIGWTLRRTVRLALGDP